MNNIQKMLLWIKNRCVLHYREPESSRIVSTINNLLLINNQIFQCDIQSKELDTIINKYYFDFNMDKTSQSEGLSIGFSDQERMSLRHNIINIYKDILQHISTHSATSQTISTYTIFDNDNAINTISNFNQI